MPSFISDVQLLLENAKKFYKKGSEELQNAEELERAFLERLQECWEEASEGRGKGRERSEERRKGRRVEEKNVVLFKVLIA